MRADRFRRWLSVRVRRWSYSLDALADRIQPPYRRKPGPESLQERIIRTALESNSESLIRSVTEPPFSLLFRTKGVLRVRLPNDFKVIS